MITIHATRVNPPRMAHQQQNNPAKVPTQPKECCRIPAEKENTESLFEKVFICSPFRPVGETPEAQAKSIKRHKILASYACRFAVANGYSPLCPHLYFPEFLDDDVEDEREIGMLLGLLGLSECKELWIIGRRISEGMRKEIAKAKEWGIPIKHYIPRFSDEERLLKAFFGEQFPLIEMV